jgi:hypothetical protein
MKTPRNFYLGIVKPSNHVIWSPLREIKSRARFPGTRACYGRRNLLSYGGRHVPWTSLDHELIVTLLLTIYLVPGLAYSYRTDFFTGCQCYKICPRRMWFPPTLTPRGPSIFNQILTRMIRTKKVMPSALNLVMVPKVDVLAPGQRPPQWPS